MKISHERRVNFKGLGSMANLLKREASFNLVKVPDREESISSPYEAPW